MKIESYINLVCDKSTHMYYIIYFSGNSPIKSTNICFCIIYYLWRVSLSTTFNLQFIVLWIYYLQEQTIFRLTIEKMVWCRELLYKSIYLKKVVLCHRLIKFNNLINIIYGIKSFYLISRDHMNEIIMFFIICYPALQIKSEKYYIYCQPTNIVI